MMAEIVLSTVVTSAIACMAFGELRSWRENHRISSGNRQESAVPAVALLAVSAVVANIAIWMSSALHW